MIVLRLSSMQPPERTDIIITGQYPCPIQMGTGMHQTLVYHEEADVLVAYHAFHEAASGGSVKVVSDIQLCWSFCLIIFTRVQDCLNE